MKKLISGFANLLVLTLLVTFTSGCGQNADDDAKEITFLAYSANNQTQKNAIEAIFANFKEESGISIKPVYAAKDEYKTKFKTNITSSKPFDIAYLDQPYLADYASKSQLADLSSFYTVADGVGVNRADFNATALETTLYDDKNYAVPLSMTTSVMLYNPDYVTTPATNWSSWLSESCPSGKAFFGSIGGEGYASWYFQSFLASNGGKLIDGSNITFNDLKGIAAAKMLRNLYDKTDATYEALRGSDFKDGNIAYRLSQAYDIMNLHIAKPTLDIKATKMISETSGGTSYSNIGGENLVVREGCGKVEQCKKFITYLLKTDNIYTIAGSNFPTITSQQTLTSVLEHNTSWAGAESALTVILDQLKTCSARPSVDSWMKVNDEYLGDALTLILTEQNRGLSEASIKDMLNSAAQQASSVTGLTYIPTV